MLKLNIQRHKIVHEFIIQIENLHITNMKSVEFILKRNVQSKTLYTEL